jgi:hypothetical protein
MPVRVWDRLVNVPVEGSGRVIPCDFCLSRKIEAQQHGGDLMMTILYQRTKERGSHESQLPEELKTEYMNRGT